jgi:hypothetical protein
MNEVDTNHARKRRAGGSASQIYEAGLGKASVPAPEPSAENPPSGPATARPIKIPRRRKLRRTADLANDDGLRPKGPFTPTELTLLQNAVEQYRSANALTQWEVRDLIQDSERSHSVTTGPLWRHICSALSHRQKAAIQKVARRKFHNYAKRGQWTPDEDEQLRLAFKHFGRKWKDIGRSINRFPEDCRDRYRNYISCGPDQKKDIWNAAETRQFKQIVEGLLVELRSDISRTAKKLKLAESAVPNDPAVESLIDWNVVSERMGKRRSRLQCRNKWEKLQEAKVRDMAIEQAHQEASQNARGTDSPRYLQAKANAGHMLPGDKFLIIRFIRDSLTSERRKYEHEIPWQLMQKATEDDCMWTLPERKICLREMKKVVKAPKKGGFLAYLEAMLSYLEETFPGQTEDYYDGPLEYLYTTVPKRTNDPRRIRAGSNASASASASALASPHTSTSTSHANSIFTPVSTEDTREYDVDEDESSGDGSEDDDEVDDGEDEVENQVSYEQGQQCLWNLDRYDHL